MVRVGGWKDWIVEVLLLVRDDDGDVDFDCELLVLDSSTLDLAPSPPPFALLIGVDVVASFNKSRSTYCAAG
jgi:hypothetical protein